MNMFEVKRRYLRHPRSVRMMRERQQFEEDMHQQFVELKKKGLGISIYTL